MVLVLCISPVGALSADDFDIVTQDGSGLTTYTFDGGGLHTCTYLNVNDPNERYIHLRSSHDIWVCSLVTFRPANLPDAPTMVVDTSYYKKEIYLPHSIDEWEIKYYTSFWTHPCEPDPEYLDNAGVVNMKEVFRPWYINGGTLYLDLSSEVSI